jgi:F-type H+-transporting ATPase subunit epsilon
MSNELDIDLLSPTKRLAAQKARMVTFPGPMGYVGLMPGHAPLISEIAVGELVVEGLENADKKIFFVSGGYLEVHHDRVKILADVIETSAEIDLQRAEKSRQRALDRLESKALDVDLPRAMGALARATGRISFLEKYQAKRSGR